MKNRGWLILLLVVVGVVFALSGWGGPYLFIGVVLLLLFPVTFPITFAVILAIVAVVASIRHDSQSQ